MVSVCENIIASRDFISGNLTMILMILQSLHVYEKTKFI